MEQGGKASGYKKKEEREMLQNELRVDGLCIHIQEMLFHIMTE